MNVDTAHISSADSRPISPAPGVMRDLLRRAWRGSPPLTAVAWLMLAALAAFGIGLLVDDRIILGAPAWLKPAKFAASTAVYALTLAWVSSYLTDAPRTRLAVGWITAGVFVIEVAIIAGQAARGTTSHFNVATPLDIVLFAIMGTAIAIQTVASGWVARALWRQPFDDRGLGAALRAGMLLTIVGAASGGLMTRPTASQLDAAHTSGRMTVSGAHTVGAPDGGPGLPGTGWSRTHGDLRVPHFVGLHALQALPLIAVVTRRRYGAMRAARLVRVAATSHAALFGLLLVQALRGEPVVAPATGTLLLLVAWAIATGGAAWIARRPSRTSPQTRSAIVMG
jgi:hypothetical protein